MNNDVVMTVSGLSKKYSRDLRRALWYGISDIARELVGGKPRPDLRRGEFWALDDISFDLRRGESLVIAGANGAGKSTLLKVLYGLLKPNRGEVRLHGRVEALIELGAGFNPLLTGLENIRVGAALYRLSRLQLNDLIERVIDFAELDEFIDTPVQSYSSGMRARLAYALAAHLDPDILLVDEVLAVGDIAFQRKCISHMHGYLARGGSLLLVSHNTYQIQAVCERGVLLEHGRLTFSGSAVDTVHRMLESGLAKAPLTASALNASGPVVIEALSAIPEGGEHIETQGSVRLTIRYRCTERVSASWSFGIWTDDQSVCVTGGVEPRTRTLEPGVGELTCVIPRLPLIAGRYVLRAAIVDAQAQYPLALLGWHDPAVALEVRATPDRITNAQMRLNQLVMVDVDWN